MTMQVALAFFLLALGSGCAHMVKLTVKPSPLRTGNKLPIHVALVINQDLANYRYNFNFQGDTWVYPFGPPLQNLARNVAEASFQEVDEIPSTSAAFKDSSADIVLVPRAVKAEQSVGVWAWEKVNLTLIMEWTALDRASQNTIWLKTITGDASYSQGNAFTMNHHRRVLIQKLFDDLSVKTQDAFEKAPELHQEERQTSRAAIQ